MLHTYGDLSDAQLLQTYGFIDMGGSTGSTDEAAGEEEAAGKGKGSKKGVAKAGNGKAKADEKAKGKGQKGKGAGKGKGKDASSEEEEEGGSEDEEGAEGALKVPAFSNPYNHALVPFSTMLGCVRDMMKAVMEGEEDQVGCALFVRVGFHLIHYVGTWGKG